jgi:hypothetical protein
MHQTEMNDFMPQSDTRASRSMDMDGWVGGFMVGERLGYGGHNDEVDDSCFLSLFQSSTCPGLVFFSCFSLMVSGRICGYTFANHKGLSRSFYAFYTCFFVSIGVELAILFCWLERNCSSILHFVFSFSFALSVLI